MADGFDEITDDVVRLSDEMYVMSEVIEFWEAMGELFEDAGPYAEELIPAGDRLLVLGTWRATVRRTGARVESRFAQVLGWRDGKLAEFRNHMDTAKVLQALEGPDGP